MHNNTITINGKKMGKSINNVIKLTELFSGDHPSAHAGISAPDDDQVLHPVEPLPQHAWFQQRGTTVNPLSQSLGWRNIGSNWIFTGSVLREKDSMLNWMQSITWLNGSSRNLRMMISARRKCWPICFEMTPIINSLKDGLHQQPLQQQHCSWWKINEMCFPKIFFGLWPISGADNEALERCYAVIDRHPKRSKKTKKDFATSDEIRNQLAELGILLKDEKVVKWAGYWIGRRGILLSGYNVLCY